jgi:hypothetical protein
MGQGERMQKLLYSKMHAHSVLTYMAYRHVERYSVWCLSCMYILSLLGKFTCCMLFSLVRLQRP